LVLDSASPSAGYLRWRVLVTALGITLAVMSAFWILMPPTYLTNDDVIIKRTLEGLIAPGAAPTGYVLSSSAVLGWILVWIERLIHRDAWDLVVAGLLIISTAALLALMWSVAVNRSDRLLPVAGAIIALAPLQEALQFTVSATLAGIAAMAMAAMELLLPVPRRRVLIGAGALLLVGLMVRPMGAAAGALVTAAALLPVAASDRDLRWRRVRRLALAAAMVVCSTVLLDYIDHAVYRLSPVWNAYRDDHWMLARFFEWRGGMPATVVTSLRARLGWSSTEWQLLQRFWGVDAAIYSHERIQELFPAWSAIVDWRLRAGWLTERMAAELNIGALLRLLAESWTALVVCALALVSHGTRRALLAALGSATIFYGACMIIEIFFKELPLRLFAPLQAGLVAAVLMTPRTIVPRTSPLMTAFCSVLAVAGVVYQSQVVASDAIAETRQSKETDAQVLELMQLRPSLLLLHGDSFPSEFWWRPFHTPPLSLPAIQLGLNNRNPYVQRFVAHSYRDSLLRGICSDPSIIVVAEQGRLDAVTAFLKEQYGADVQWSEVYSGSFRAWRCSLAGSH